MRFVHVIARLKESMVACDKVLDDLDEMACDMLDADRPYSDSDRAMMKLITAVEMAVCKERSRLDSRLKGYEYRRDLDNGTATYAQGLEYIRET